MVLPAAIGNGAAHQAWRVVTTDAQGITATYVDAATGETCAGTGWRRSSTTGSRRAVTGRGRVSTPTPWSRCSAKASPTGRTQLPR